MVAVAELEAGMISKRTKDALPAAKQRGKVLGGNRGVPPYPSLVCVARYTKNTVSAVYCALIQIDLVLRSYSRDAIAPERCMSLP